MTACGVAVVQMATMLTKRRKYHQNLRRYGAGLRVALELAIKYWIVTVLRQLVILGAPLLITQHFP